MAKTGQLYFTRQVHYLRRDIAFNTPGIGTDATVEVGVLPRNALVLATHVAVSQAFNAGTTNVLIVGTAADNDALVAAAGVDETAVALTTVPPATLAGLVASAAGDTPVYAKYTQTGAAASAGAAVIVVAYAPAEVA